MKKIIINTLIIIMILLPGCHNQEMDRFQEAIENISNYQSFDYTENREFDIIISNELNKTSVSTNGSYFKRPFKNKEMIEWKGFNNKTYNKEYCSGEDKNGQIYTMIKIGEQWTKKQIPVSEIDDVKNYCTIIRIIPYIRKIESISLNNEGLYVIKTKVSPNAYNRVFNKEVTNLRENELSVIGDITAYFYIDKNGNITKLTVDLLQNRRNYEEYLWKDIDKNKVTTNISQKDIIEIKITNINNAYNFDFPVIENKITM